MITPSTGPPSLPGHLYLYAAGRSAFESPGNSIERANKLILLGGLSDGLWPVPYTHLLYETAIHSNPHWSLVQPILSSSYLGFGHGSLERDTRELGELFACLMQQQQESSVSQQQSFAMAGHSTGCQNAVHYMKHGAFKDRLKVIALQAPVSDREHAQLVEDDYAQNLETAQTMRHNGQAEEMMPRSAFWAPITASRFLDLQENGGTDDFFSSDYTDDQLVERLGHVGEVADRQVLVAFSGADEYVPAAVGDSSVLADRLTRAMNAHCPADRPVAKTLYLPKANHNLSEAPGDADLFVQAVSEMLQGVN